MTGLIFINVFWHVMFFSSFPLILISISHLHNPPISPSYECRKTLVSVPNCSALTRRQDIVFPIVLLQKDPLVEMDRWVTCRSDCWVWNYWFDLPSRSAEMESVQQSWKISFRTTHMSRRRSSVKEDIHLITFYLDQTLFQRLSVLPFHHLLWQLMADLMCLTMDHLLHH